MEIVFVGLDAAPPAIQEQIRRRCGGQLRPGDIHSGVVRVWQDDDGAWCADATWPQLAEPIRFYEPAPRLFGAARRRD